MGYRFSVSSFPRLVPAHLIISAHTEYLDGEVHANQNRPAGRRMQVNMTGGLASTQKQTHEG